MNLLALETATDVCGVALVEAGRLVAELSLRRPRAHAENLVPMVEQALALAGWRPPDLDVVAVSQGPGSYTGLRIGVSTAKGLALATGARLVAVPSLEALAAAAAPQAAEGDALLALFNARRDEVYAAAFRRAAAGSLDALAPTVAIKLDALPEWLGEANTRRLWLVGEGGPKAAPVFAAAGFAAVVLDPEVVAPSAAAVARQALLRVEAGAFEDVAAFEPYYLKAFVAKKPKDSIFDRLTF